MRYRRMIVTRGSPTRCQENFEPAGTRSNFLSGVFRSPAFGEADADGVNVDGAGRESGSRIIVAIAVAVVVVTTNP